MRFSYQARTATGEVQTGFVEASSREAALAVLQKYKLYVTFLSEVKEPFWQKRIEVFKRVSKRDIVAFTRQLAIMLKSDIPVVESLETIARQTKKPRLRETILKIAEQVEGGSSLSQSFSTHKKFFSPFYVGMVRSGETSGKVPESLNYLADYLEREQDFTSGIIMAMIYPAFVLAVFFMVMFVMSIVVVPKFSEIFAGMETDLPLLTRIVIQFADFMKKQWPVLLFSFFCLGLSIFLLLKSRETKKFLEKLSLKLPLIGDFFRKFFMTRIALNLSTLISGGIPISQALEITGDVVGNDVYKDIMLKTRDGVRAGQNISSILAAYPERFSLLFIQMIVVGEKTGHLERTLQNVVDLYQKETERTLDAFIKSLEPIMIIILGGLVTLLALALFVPLFQRGELII